MWERGWSMLINVPYLVVWTNKLKHAPCDPCDSPFISHTHASLMGDVRALITWPRVTPHDLPERAGHPASFILDLRKKSETCLREGEHVQNAKRWICCRGSYLLQMYRDVCCLCWLRTYAHIYILWICTHTHTHTHIHTTRQVMCLWRCLITHRHTHPSPISHTKQCVWAPCRHALRVLCAVLAQLLNLIGNQYCIKMKRPQVAARPIIKSFQLSVSISFTYA